MIVGREYEQRKLREAVESNSSQFIAIYGRRRIGKTYLVRETFGNKFTFSYTGAANQKSRTQLRLFYSALCAQGLEKSEPPSDWFKAFELLVTLISKSKSRKKIVFLDELPWMDNPRSSFVPAIEHFWNGWASARHDVVLIICGSATSWIINKVFKNRGGLYNRVTCQLGLDLFTLRECEQYAKQMNLQMSRNEIMEAYMIFGGVPYYWSLLDRKMSLAQNVNQLFFSEKGMLRHEFNALYSSIFNNPNQYINIITTLAKKKMGMTRAEIIDSAKISDNGNLTRIIDDLEHCDFIRHYNSIGKKRNGKIYQLIDSYTLFYFRFVDNQTLDDKGWLRLINTPKYNTWHGLAFEQVCLLHTNQIKKAIGIGDVISNVCAWRFNGDSENQGVQIDMVIDREDRVINLCEMKYSDRPYSITKQYNRQLQYKRLVFCEKTGTRKSVRMTMITSNGLVKNTYSQDILNQLTADDLFIN